MFLALPIKMFSFRSRLLYLTLQKERAARCLCSRSTGSALYITGDKAKDMFVTIYPHVDAEERFKNMSSLVENLKHRGINPNIDKLKTLWDILSDMEKDKNILEDRRVVIAAKIKELSKINSEEHKKEVERLKLQGKIIREDMKAVIKAVWELEKKTVARVLRLPNDLHPQTPIKEETVLKMVENEFMKIKTESHLQIGAKLDVLEYYSPTCYYLKGSGVLCELGIMQYFMNVLEENGFVRFCNSDFVRSVVVEGSGTDHENPSTTFILEDIGDILENKDVNHLHLVGGSSLPSFCAFLAKETISPKSLPLKFVTSGRQYTPTSNIDTGHSLGLFNVCQASSVELFVGARSYKDIEDEFDKTLNLITSAYMNIGYPFRVVYAPAKSLKDWESLRASFQVYSSFLQSYVETGSLSLSSDYISKRLLICNAEKANETNFIYILSGNIVSVPKLLGCILELNKSMGDKCDFIPHIIKQHIPVL